ncbi:MAG: T9SS type A sorting domain-containing protein [Chitinophagales bacterium]|nr:T9SS type A sorting domain-containing protein [Chitinophagales bacterium]MDW8393588.1 T9SS type A sorting domain-containing protein [Chitinophagales bacterium]
MSLFLRCILIISFLGVITGSAQTPDWSTQIAPILYNRCAPCHHSGGVAPFPLITYNDAVQHAFSIQAQVNARLMPPFPADPDCSVPLLKDRHLTQQEIDYINEWVNGGMPAGNLNNAPAPPTFSTGSALPVIDQVFQFPAYTVPASTDQFRTFVLPTGFTSTKYLNQIEFQISNPEIVHHILLYYDPTTASLTKDQNEPGPGFTSNGTNSPSSSAVLIAGWVPGMEPEILPADFGYEIPANSYLAMEIHYAPGSQGKVDSTRVNLKFCAHPSPRAIYVSPVLFHYWPSLTNGPFIIPANTIKTFYEKSTVSLGDYSIYSILPHAHLICTRFDVYMTKPNSTDTVRLLCIPRWDFRWQLSYPLKNLVRFTPGSGYRLGARAVYDNTANNPNNPNNPPAMITLGEKTTDEMMVVFFAYLAYKPGDELIDLQTGTSQPQTEADQLHLFPNPAYDLVNLQAWISGGPVTMTLYNSAGMVVWQKQWDHQPQGSFADVVDVSKWAPGFYLAELRGNGFLQRAPLVKQ